jgi:signal transduction histidine kinase
LNFKKLDFIISSSIITAFIILIVLIANNILVSMLGFSQNTFPLITTILILLGVVVHLLFIKTLFEPIFKSDEHIKDIIKETIHELNTPVATIQLNTKMLSKNEVNDKNLKRLNRIEESCQNLLDIYNQMEYNLKKEVSDNIIDTFELNEVIIKSINNFEDIKKDIKISNNVKSKIYINGDKNGFIKMLNNLISNAIKYNKPNGFINIELKNNILSIQDDGIGISTDKIFNIFDKYFQEDLSKQGFGLGLHTVKEFCNRSNIKINIDSKIEEGTIIYLNLSNIVATN